jgi:hypothetical protein
MKSNVPMGNEAYGVSHRYDSLKLKSTNLPAAGMEADISALEAMVAPQEKQPFAQLNGSWRFQ